MCKNDKNHKHCHSHNNECKKEGKKKFDYKKFIKKRDGERKLGFDDLKFNGLFAELEFPNGLVMHVTRDELGAIEMVTITDGKDWRHREYLFDVFPELYRKLNQLHHASDTMILTDAIRMVEALSKEEFLNFGKNK